MTDIATVASFLGSIKTASEIAKTIKGADLSLEKAETKLKLAELIEALAEAKMQAADVQDIIREKDEKITILEKAFEFKSKLIRKDGFYFDTQTDKFSQDPFCSHCWESNNKPIHLTLYGTSSEGSNLYMCPSCENKFKRYSY